MAAGDDGEFFFWVSGLQRRTVNGPPAWKLEMVYFEDLPYIRGADYAERWRRPVYFLGAVDRVEAESTLLHEVHLNRGGWILLLQGEEPPIAPPFLVTEDAGLRPIFHGEVEVHGPADLLEWLADPESGIDFPVRCDRWSGVVRMPAVADRPRGLLWAFSDDPTAVVLDGEALDMLDPIAPITLSRVARRGEAAPRQPLSSEDADE